MNWNDYIWLRENLLQKFELGKISEEQLDLHLKRLDNKVNRLGIVPTVVENEEEDEDWVDPAGGFHYAGEDGPAAMYI